MNIKNISLSLIFSLSFNKLNCLEGQIQKEGETTTVKESSSDNSDDDDFEQISSGEVSGFDSINPSLIDGLFSKLYPKCPKKYHNLNLFLAYGNGITINQAILGNDDVLKMLENIKNQDIPNSILQDYTSNGFQQLQVNSAFKKFILDLYNSALREKTILDQINKGEKSGLLSLFLSKRLNKRMFNSLKSDEINENDKLILHVAIELNELYGYGSMCCENCVIL